mmetsp:Transcript_71283/g.112945  ORF Transcript_71283/g.112945 Transcript_71283/m.112945 type:complete len:366 (+) Transcript_71283:113-1210(+)
MAALREIVAARAKVPAKIHSMEANGPKQIASTPTGGPMIVEYSAQQMAADHGGVNANAPRPPRAPGVGSPGGTPPNLRKPSEGRKPRSSSESRVGPTGRRSPSEPPVQKVSDIASDNGRAPAPKAKARASSVNRAKLGDAAPPVDRKDVGKVPAYLRRRQEEMAEEKRIANRPHSPQAPPGYRKVPDNEKQATLDVLRARKKEVEIAQRNLPFKIETLGQKQREKDLTDRLAHLDKLLGMFGQPVVFIPADAEPIAVTVPPLPQGLQGRPTRERDSDPSSQEVVPNRVPETRRSREAEGNLIEASVRVPSRESRARANADRRMQAGVLAPWDRGHESPSIRNELRTEVKVQAPPGGKSSFSLGWD